MKRETTARKKSTSKRKEGMQKKKGPFYQVGRGDVKEEKSTP